MDIIEFAENLVGNKLTEYQKVLLKALHQGKVVAFSKQSGRKQCLEIMKEYNEIFTK